MQKFETVADVFIGLSIRQARRLRGRILPTLAKLREEVIRELPEKPQKEPKNGRIRESPPVSEPEHL